MVVAWSIVKRELQLRNLRRKGDRTKDPIQQANTLCRIGWQKAEAIGTFCAVSRPRRFRPIAAPEVAA